MRFAAFITTICVLGFSTGCVTHSVFKRPDYGALHQQQQQLNDVEIRLAAEEARSRALQNQLDSLKREALWLIAQTEEGTSHRAEAINISNRVKRLHDPSVSNESLAAKESQVKELQRQVDALKDTLRKIS
ncbi:MAG: hypothetical protein FWD61_02810 [Phycisphaerales bacterium]|nr:hypothetical protein [Phycisphaerales bacterium]